jgi:hypothetical protein
MGADPRSEELALVGLSSKQCLYVLGVGDEEPPWRAEGRKLRPDARALFAAPMEGRLQRRSNMKLSKRIVCVFEGGMMVSRHCEIGFLREDTLLGITL